MGLLARLAFAPLLLAGVGQTATVSIDDVSAALRRDPVYVEPGADGVVDAGALRSRIEAKGVPVKIAVLTPETVDASGGADAALREIIDATGINAAYGLVTEKTFRAGPPGPAASAGTAAFNAARSDGPEAVVQAYVDRVADVVKSGSSDGGSSDDSGGGSSLLPILVVGGGLAGGAWLINSSRKKNQRLAEQRIALQGAQQDLRAELSVLADDVLRLEPEVEVHPEARQDYDAAVSRYKWLDAGIAQIDSPDDPPRIQRAMAEARYAMARAQAIVRGHEPPAPPAELTAPGRYGEPAIEVDEEDEYRRPRYAGYGGGWYGGGFFGGNDLFTGILLGHMLGGGFGWGGPVGGFGGGFGRDGNGDNDGGDGRGWFDGGFGGGDFGGGDFGGGDFGGGDF